MLIIWKKELLETKNVIIMLIIDKQVVIYKLANADILPYKWIKSQINKKNQVPLLKGPCLVRLGPLNP